VVVLVGWTSFSGPWLFPPYSFDKHDVAAGRFAEDGEAFAVVRPGEIDDRPGRHPSLDRHDPQRPNAVLGRIEIRSPGDAHSALANELAKIQEGQPGAPAMNDAVTIRAEQH